MNILNRRNFFKLLGMSSISITMPKVLFARNMKTDKTNMQFIKSADEMRPREILEAINRGPYAFITVSPTYEWHSFHLPMGTDALIPQELSKLAAGKIGGIWFRPLSMGLDAWRVPKEKEMWGFNPEEEVYGMNFPDLPLRSEYCEQEEMVRATKNRIKALRNSGVKHAFLLNHHGGKGQFQTVIQIAEEATSDKMAVHALSTYQFNDLSEKDGWISIGGHAGISETTWLAAFRPDLVDLNEQKKGSLSVRHTGVLHSKPEIEEEWNPVNISFEVAKLLRERVIVNFTAHVLNCCTP